MNVKSTNAAEAQNDPGQYAEPIAEPDDDSNGPVTEPNLLSGDEVIDRRLIRLKKLFNQVEIQNIPGTEASPVSRRLPRQSATRRSSKPRARSRRNRARSSPQTLNQVTHQSRCSVCRHPYRENIEEEFIHWHSPHEIGTVYGVEKRSIYRHAHALNLFAVRDRNLRFALGHIIDEAERCFRITGGDVVRAVHAFARVNDEGQWFEPSSHVIVSSGSSPAAPRRPALHASQQPALPSPNAENSAENSAPLSVNLGRTEPHSND